MIPKKYIKISWDYPFKVYKLQNLVFNTFKQLSWSILLWYVQESARAERRVREHHTWIGLMYIRKRNFRKNTWNWIALNLCEMSTTEQTRIKLLELGGTVIGKSLNKRKNRPNRRRVIGGSR
jgi:hypothetical protein